MKAAVLAILKKLALRLLSEYIAKRLVIALLKDLQKQAKKTGTTLDDEFLKTAIDVLEGKRDEQ